MNKIIIVSLLSLIINADPISKVQSFSNSLDKYLLIKPSHLEAIVPHIRIKKPNAFQRWQMERSGAEATYNDITNTIVLRDKNFVGTGASLRIKSYEDFAINEKYMFFSLAPTIFHELTHADYDVTIEGSGSQLAYFLNDKLIPWFSKNFRGYNSKIATHELFGYTAGDSISALYNKINDIMLSHGVRYPALECFSIEALKRIKARLKFGEEIEFQNVYPNQDFSLEMTPNYVFVKGEGLDLKAANFPLEYRRELYSYFVDTYKLPIDMDDLIEKLNNSHFKNLLQKCYKDI